MRTFKRAVLAVLLALAWGAEARGKVDLVTLPERERVQLTIYNSADLTLARERRELTLAEGMNELQFSWANTLIDPTSLELVPMGRADAIDVWDLTFEPRVREAGLWHVASEVAGPAPVEIAYLTSGLSWRAFYLATLGPDEKTMTLDGFVRVQNSSGEEYENAQVRLVVGQVHLIDQIAELARREQPYGRPGEVILGAPMRRGRAVRREMEEAMDMAAPRAMAAEAPARIIKEGLSEYFLYTIEGEQTVPDGWSKRLKSFTAQEVPVVNLYKHDPGRFGEAVVRYLSFTNDAEHRLGETPIPGGDIKAYRRVDGTGHLSYEGQSGFKYIPVGEEVELNLGAVEDIIVEDKLMGYRTEEYRFQAQHANVSGWDEVRSYEVTVKNTRELPVRVELRRHLENQYWQLEKSGDFGSYEKIDLTTVQFTLEVEPRSEKKFTYTTRVYQGSRRQDWRPLEGHESATQQ